MPVNCLLYHDQRIDDFFLNWFHFFLFAGSWRNVTKSMYPPARFGMVYGSSNEFFYIATGEGEDGNYFNDMWKFDIRCFTIVLFNKPCKYMYIFYQSFKLVLFVVFCSLSEFYALKCLLFSDLKNGRSWAGQTGTISYINMVFIWKKNVYTLVSSFSKLELCFWLQTTIERPLLSQASVWGLGRSISREFQVLRPPGNLGY